MKPSDVIGSARRFAGHNWELKLLALGLAIACWFFVAGESKVLVGFSVPLEIRDVPRGMTVTNCRILARQHKQPAGCNRSFHPLFGPRPLPHGNRPG